MAQSGWYETSFSINTFDVSSTGNTAFFGFVGDRLYKPFHTMVAPSDLELFYQMINRRDSEYFALRMLAEDGKEVWCAACATESGEDCCLFRFMPLHLFVSRYFMVMQTQKFAEYLLEVIGEMYFTYSGALGGVELFYIHKSRQTIKRCSLDEFEKYLTAKAKRKDKGHVTSFVRNFASGMGFFTYTAEGNLLDDEVIADSTTLKGVSFEDERGFVHACGIIHRGTAENAAASRLPDLDYLTGILTKAEITQKAQRFIDVSKKAVSIAIIDVDNFKTVNDTYGHQVGDQVLKVVAGIIENSMGPHAYAGRIGGDEFMVIFTGVEDFEENRTYLRGIKNGVHIAFPENDEGKPVVTLSIGCAAFPKDANNFNDVLMLADYALYLAKQKGRNRYIIYSGDKHSSLEEIKTGMSDSFRAAERAAVSPGEFICVVYDKLMRKSEYPIHKFLEEISLNLNVQRVVLYSGDSYRFYDKAGPETISEDGQWVTDSYLNDPEYQKLFAEDGILMISNIDYFQDRMPDIYATLKEQESYAILQIKAFDRKHTPLLLSLESVGKKLQWDETHRHYYRTLGQLLKHFEI